MRCLDGEFNSILEIYSISGAINPSLLNAISKIHALNEIRGQYKYAQAENHSNVAPSSDDTPPQDVW